MTSQPGWHPDPVPGAPGQAPLLRYWDGQRWTEHTAPFPDQRPPVGAGPAQPQTQSQAQYGQPTKDGSSPTPPGGQPDVDRGYDQAAQAQIYGQQAYPQTYGQPAYAQTGRSGYAVGGKQTTTPDGVPLAGWWQRVAANLIDSLVLLPVTAILFIPFYPTLAHTFSDYVDQVDQASRTGAPLPSTTQFQRDLLPTLFEMSLVSLALILVWSIVWLRTKQATPGKLAVGLRVRRRAAPGPMPIGLLLVRWAAQYLVLVISLIPIIGLLASLYVLLDVLWASWDDKRQTLHDKAAGTNVVRVR